MSIGPSGVQQPNTSRACGSPLSRMKNCEAARATSGISSSPAAYVRLSATASYSLLLAGNLFHNRGAAGVDGLDLKNDPLASGDRNAWYGYSNFYGTLAPGGNDSRSW